eukprot:15344844-Ditylum_brightwellii.AAC.1
MIFSLVAKKPKDVGNAQEKYASTGNGHTSTTSNQLTTSFSSSSLIATAKMSHDDDGYRHKNQMTSAEEAA